MYKVISKVTFFVFCCYSIHSSAATLDQIDLVKPSSDPKSRVSIGIANGNPPGGCAPVSFDFTIGNSLKLPVVHKFENMKAQDLKICDAVEIRVNNAHEFIRVLNDRYKKCLKIEVTTNEIRVIQGPDLVYINKDNSYYCPYNKTVIPTEIQSAFK